MGDVNFATSDVIDRAEIICHKQVYGQTDFWLSDAVIDGDYTAATTAQIRKIGLGGGSMWPAAHRHGANRSAELRHAARRSRETDEGKAAQRQQHGDDDLISSPVPPAKYRRRTLTSCAGAQILQRAGSV